MTRRSILSALPLTVTLAIGAPPDQLTEQEKSIGWQMLFDGHTTAGWLEISGLPFPPTWIVEGGCLKAMPNPDGMQDLRTAGSFRSFDLSFEWKIARGGNSGVKYFVAKVDRWPSKTKKGFQARARGAEYQLVDEKGHPDGALPSKTSGALYGVYPPSKIMSRQPGLFNYSRIVVQGNHVEHWLNGEKVLEYQASAPLESPIALQNHGSEVWFRNLKIRRLPQD